MKYCIERIYKNLKRNCTVIINTSVVRTNPSTQSSLPSSPALALPRSDRPRRWLYNFRAQTPSDEHVLVLYSACMRAHPARAHTHRRRRARVPAYMQTGIQAQWKQRYPRIHYGTLKRRKSLILSICYTTTRIEGLISVCVSFITSCVTPRSVRHHVQSTPRSYTTLDSYA